MSVLDLTACPICQAGDGLARQTTKVEGRSHITYECLRCGSVLLWLGDDLWLEADRWAYQEVGRPEMAHLLHQTMTADELRRLAKPRRDGPYAQPPLAPARQERPRDREPVILSSNEWSPEPPEPQAWQPAVPIKAPPALEDDLWEGEPPLQGAESASAPSLAAPTAQALSLPRRSRGSPFLAVSVALIMSCLLCASAAMIASSSLAPKATPEAQLTDALASEIAPTETPQSTATSPPTELPDAGQAPLPAPTEAPALLFQGVTDYVTSSGSHYIVGEVLNTTDRNLRFVEILASFYDGNGQLVGTGSTFAEISIVEAGSSAPFKLATLDPPASLASYKLRFDYLETGEQPVRLEVLDHQASYADNGWHHIVGEVRNAHDFPVKFPEIIATYHNASLQVVRVEVSFSELDPLQPGQTSSFEVILVDPPGDLHEYTLQTEAVPQ